MAHISFRELILRMAPPWLNEEIGSRLLYAIGAQLDAMGDQLWAGMDASKPDYAALYCEEALAVIGRDRRIYRGFDESPENYAKRLIRWLDDWPVAGSAYAIMQQLQGYLSGHEVRLRVVNSKGAWRTLNADGTREYHRAAPTNWTWDTSDSSKPTRFWVVIYPPSTLWLPGPSWGDPALWSGAWGSSGYTIGSTATPDQVRSVRNIVSEWKDAASKCDRIVLAFDPDSFDPMSTPGAPMPDGTWGSFSNSSEPRGKARLATARYWRGTP